MKIVLLVLLVACSRDTQQHTPCHRASPIELRVVDDDSPYMKKLFAHVGLERDGAATEPDAIAAGIRAEVDYWKDQESLTPVRHSDYYLIGPTKDALATYFAKHADAPPSDREVVFEDMGKGWRSYYVHKAPMIDEGSIGFIEIGTNAITNTSTLVFTLYGDGRQRFADGTKAATGKKVATLIDGVVMSAPVVNGAITGGRFTLNMPSQAIAEATLDKLGCVRK